MQSLTQIVSAPAFIHEWSVIQLDLGNEQSSEPLRAIVVCARRIRRWAFQGSRCRGATSRQRFEASARMPDQEFDALGPCAWHCALGISIVIGVKDADGLAIHQKRNGNPNAIV